MRIRKLKCPVCGKGVVKWERKRDRWALYVHEEATCACGALYSSNGGWVKTCVDAKVEKATKCVHDNMQELRAYVERQNDTLVCTINELYERVVDLELQLAEPDEQKTENGGEA